MLTSYEKLLEQHKQKNVIDQNRALQTLFDFKFLSSVFGDRSKSEVGLYPNHQGHVVRKLDSDIHRIVFFSIALKLPVARCNFD